jgi:hypothetical protein
MVMTPLDLQPSVEFTSLKVDDFYWVYHTGYSHIVLVCSSTFNSSRLLKFPRFFFPDSPTTAWFLTNEEKKVAVQRIKVHHISSFLYKFTNVPSGQSNGRGEQDVQERAVWAFAPSQNTMQ